MQKSKKNNINSGVLFQVYGIYVFNLPIINRIQYTIYIVISTSRYFVQIRKY